MNTDLSRRDFLKAGASLALLASAPKTFAQDGDAKTFEVGVSWYDTGIDLKEGDSLEMIASGIVDIGGSYGELSRPDGWDVSKDPGDYVLPSAKRFSLVGCIGDVKDRSNYFPVGSKVEQKPVSKSGRLRLSVNDHRLCDNKGAYDVKLTHNGKEALKSVPGHGGFWVNTGYNIEAGKAYVITATGEVDIGGTNKEKTTPKGWDLPKDGEYPLQSAPRFGLIGCIGDISRDDPKNSAYFAIGEKLEFTAKESGRLYVAVNDHFHADNTGAFKVTVAKK
jgi:hypothetical protein